MVSSTGCGAPIAVLPICFDEASVERLAGVIDPTELAAQRGRLVVSLKEDVSALAQQLPELAFVMDAEGVRKMRRLIEVLQRYAVLIREL